MLLLGKIFWAQVSGKITSIAERGRQALRQTTCLPAGKPGRHPRSCAHPGLPSPVGNRGRHDRGRTPGKARPNQLLSSGRATPGNGRQQFDQGGAAHSDAVACSASLLALN
jgi:hypothetical protein